MVSPHFQNMFTYFARHCRDIPRYFKIIFKYFLYIFHWPAALFSIGPPPYSAISSLVHHGIGVEMCCFFIPAMHELAMLCDPRLRLASVLSKPKPAGITNITVSLSGQNVACVENRAAGHWKIQEKCWSCFFNLENCEMSKKIREQLFGKCLENIRKISGSSWEISGNRFQHSIDNRFKHFFARQPV